MTTFYTSDLHFAHKRICEFTDRKLVTTQEGHDAWLIDLWNKQVKRNDTVWHLGDFSFDWKDDSLTQLLSKLNGQKFFVKGNHDEGKSLDKLVQKGLIDNWYDYREGKINKTKVILFHFPISAWHQQHRESWHLHGHCHGTASHLEGKILDVGLDSAYNIFGEHRFFTEDDIQSIMQKKELHTEDHHTYRKGE